MKTNTFNSTFGYFLILSISSILCAGCVLDSRMLSLDKSAEVGSIDASPPSDGGDEGNDEDAGGGSSSFLLSLDNTFANSGVFTFNYSGTDDERPMAMTSVGAQFYIFSNLRRPSARALFGMLRIDQAGSVDTSFGTSGRLLTFAETSGTSTDKLDYLYGGYVVSDGKFLLFGDSSTKAPNWDDDAAIVRLNSNGSYDSTFSGDGKLQIALAGTNNDSIVALAVQSNGNYVGCGVAAYTGANPNFSLFRVLSNGNIDTAGFNAGGPVPGINNIDFNGETDNCSAILMHNYSAQERIVAVGKAGDGSGGYDSAIVRLNSAGVLDTTFNTTGYRQIDFSGGNDEGVDVLLLSDDSYLVLSRVTVGSQNDIAVHKILPNGNIDTSWGNSGFVSFDLGSSSNDRPKKIIALSGNRFAIGGTTDAKGTDDYFVLLMDSNGQLLPSYGTDDFFTFGFYSGVDTFQNFYLNSSSELFVVGVANNASVNNYGIVKLTIATGGL